jgi:excisionase family DNA binding protein
MIVGNRGRTYGLRCFVDRPPRTRSPLLAFLRISGHCDNRPSSAMSRTFGQTSIEVIPMSAIEPLAMSVTDAAKFLGVGIRKMRELVRAKKIKAHMLDGLIKVRAESCRDFLDSLPEYKKAKGLRNQH